jgi:hypothetical protein
VANEEQLRILRQGAEAWNAWRQRRRSRRVTPRIDLRDADLHTANLGKASAKPTSTGPTYGETSARPTSARPTSGRPSSKGPTAPPLQPRLLVPAWAWH